MNGDDKNQCRDDKRAGQSLPWMKRHGRPCGWRTAFMVDRMCGLEPIWPMHQAVGPIKPSIVRKKIQEDRGWQIPERKGIDLRINSCPTKAVPTPSDNPARYAVNCSTREAPANLALDLAVETGI